VDWSQPGYYTPGSGQTYVDTFSEGRYMSFEFIASGGAVIQFEGFDVIYEPRGTF
jgi:hypothetical protein